MKLPVLKVKALPSFYKHCSTVYTIHIDIHDISLVKEYDKSFVDAYFSRIKEQVYQAAEANFVINLASQVSSDKETFVIFKDAIPAKVLHEFINAIIAEFDSYCDQRAEITYHFMKVTLFDENQSVKIFKTGKLGDDLLTSKVWETEVCSFHKKSRPRGKYLSSIKEFQAYYDCLKKVPGKPQTKKLQEISSDKMEEVLDEGTYQYYI